ncbi:hypothetical protein PM8797T_23504 [Gimesia maris DSM 8797]|nr:hypothetical protein PM8797T_23504 [Gimesia maris DSM 8797]
MISENKISLLKTFLLVISGLIIRKVEVAEGYTRGLTLYAAFSDWI